MALRKRYETFKATLDKREVSVKSRVALMILFSFVRATPVPTMDHTCSCLKAAAQLGLGIGVE
jgi:hypothetical protein